MVVHLKRPPRSAEAAGVVREFKWRGNQIEATGDISRGEAGLVITRIEVLAPMPMGLTHKLLQRIPLGDVLAAARADINYQIEQSIIAADRPQEPLPPGRILVTDDLLRQVARAYLEETGPGKDRAVLDRLVERLGRPKGTIRTWIARARAEGWLGPAVQGRVGAEPGPKLMTWQTEEFKRDHPGVFSHEIIRPDGSRRDVSKPFSIYEPDDHQSSQG